MRGITWAALPRWTQEERRRAGLAVALAVFSHFVLDWLVHIPDLPLLGNDSLKMGLGLWNTPLLALALETALVLAGFIFYMIAVKPESNLKRWGLGLLLLLVMALTVTGTLFAETPPPASGAGASIRSGARGRRKRC